MNKTFRVSGRLAVRLGELDVSVPAVLRRAGLPQDLFEQTRVLVNTSALFALWGAIAEISKDSAIGLKLGTESRMEAFHPSALAALSTESFGGAIGHMARYKQLTCPEEIVHEVTGDEWPIQFRWVLTVDAEPHALIEYCFAWLHTIVTRERDVLSFRFAWNLCSRASMSVRWNGTSDVRLSAERRGTRWYTERPIRGAHL